MNSSAFENGSAVRMMSFDVPVDVIQIPVPQIVFRSTIIVVGTLLNALLLAVVCVSRQLHYPRHLYWATVAVINLYSLAVQIMEILAIFYHDNIACQLYVLNASVGYSLLLVCLLLVAFDRYLVISNQVWYKKKVTNRAVIILLSGAMLATYAAVTCPFWTGLKSISSCTVNLTHMHWVLVGNLLLSISCLAIHGKIFMMSRSIIIDHPQLFGETANNAKFCNTMCTYQRRGHGHQVRYTNEVLRNRELEPSLFAEHSLRKPENETGETTPKENDSIEASAENVTIVLETNENKIELSPWFSRTGISKLEIRAALNLSINILPFWVCTLPVSFNTLVIYWCIKLEVNCTTILAINPFLRNMFLLNSIYNPIMYMLTCTEFRRALFQLCAKLCRRMIT